MAQEYRVTFVGDLGNLAQFDQAVRSSFAGVTRSLQEANLAVASTVGNIKGTLSQAGKTEGLFVANPKTIIDSYNNTFRQTGQVIRRYVKGFEEEFKNGQYVIKPVFEDQYFASFDKAIGNYKQYTEAIRQTGATEAAIAKDFEQSAQRRVDLLNEIDRVQHQIAGYGSAIQAKIQRPDAISKAFVFDDYEKLKRLDLDIQSGAALAIPPNQRQFLNVKDIALSYDRVISRIRELKNQIQEGIRPTSSATAPLSQKVISELQNQLAVYENILQNAPNRISAARGEIAQSIQSMEALITNATQSETEAIRNLNVEKARLEKEAAAVIPDAEKRAQALRRANPAYAQAEAAQFAIPPIQHDLDVALNQSKELRKQLLAGGLGAGERYGSQQFQAALAEQEAQVSRFVRNLRTGVTSVQGSFRNLQTGILEEFTVDLDKNGQVIGRWGGQLSGAGAILRQTVRDFQKVIEWTIATTAVFGALGLAIKSVGTINELNTSLTRFSITAQLTAEETNDLFKDLGQVAIQTATPLQELIKVADDIALATKRAGDSTDEWKAKIVDLTTAVGIFTNLTGEDTVDAADKLSSAFKQLGIAPSELVGVLSKVTAVAGGQATAINEIVTALASVAEAGKAAQLTVDEQIASVQVLSQVTNKSAADVATAFKNLFGSVSSPGSEKILKEFNIDIRDASGNLKPFLDIYREVKDALDAGIIPPGRYQDVLRGIAGGPRRAPDAAALLGNLNAVEAAIAKSTSATNEALVANAKILDTNAAKIQQLQNAFDIALYEKFGKVVQDITNSLTGLATTVLQVFNGINTPVVTLVAQLGAVVVAGKLLGTVLKTLGPLGVAPFKSIGAAATEAYIALETYSRRAAIPAALGTGRMVQGPAGPNSFLIGTPGINDRIAGLQRPKFIAGEIANYVKQAGPLRQFALVAGGAAAAVTTLDAASKGFEGIDPQAIGTFLQLAGATSVATGVFAPLGAAALVAGTALQFLGGQNQLVKKSAAEVAKEVYTLTQNYKDAKSDVELYAKQQADAKSSLDAIISSGKKDADTKAAQTQATNEFVTATLNLVDANKKVSDTLDEIYRKIPGLSDEYDRFKNLVKGGLINPQDLKDLQVKLAQQILKGSGQGVFSTTNFNKTSISPIYKPPANFSTTSQVEGPGGRFDFRDLIDNPTLLNKIIGPQGGTTSSVFAQLDAKNLAYVQNALAQLSRLVIEEGKGPEIGIDENRLQQLIDAVNQFSERAGSYVKDQVALVQQQAEIQSKVALSVFSQQQGQNALLANKLAGQINEAQSDFKPRPTKRTGGADIDENKKLIDDAQRIKAELFAAADKGLELTNQQLIDSTRLMLTLNGTIDSLGDAGDSAINQAIYQSLVNAQVPAEKLKDIMVLLGLTMDQVAQKAPEVTAAFEKANQAAAEAFANRELQLTIGENNGDFDKNAKGLATLRAQSKQAYTSIVELNDAISNLSSGAMAELNNQLSQVIGLQGQWLTQNQIASLSEEEIATQVTNATAKLYENAIAAGVNSEGLKKIQEDIAKVIGLIIAIPTYKQVVIDIQTRLSGSASAGNGYPSGGFNAIQQELDNAAANDSKNSKAQQKAINDLIKKINQIIASGKGDKLGSLPSAKDLASATKKQPDVSTLDLPEEIANAANRSQLIQEAIKRARELQSKIPGANKEASDDIVELLKGTQRILEVRGVKDDLLRKALEELADIEKKRLEFETKADVIRRIRIGAGDFSAIANVPLNTKTGVSLGSPSGPITVNIGLTGQLLTPAQFQQLADMIAASLKRQIANG